MNPDNRVDIVLITGALASVTLSILAFCAYTVWGAGPLWKMEPVSSGGMVNHFQGGWFIAPFAWIGGIGGCVVARWMLRRRYPDSRPVDWAMLLLCCLGALLLASYPVGFTVHYSTGEERIVWYVLPIVIIADVAFFFLGRYHLNKPAIEVPWRGGGQQF